MNRQFLFKNYFWIAIFVAILAVALIFYFYEDGRMPLIGSVLATFLAFCHFIQQQRLAEISLFKDLFVEFNARYDKINDDLSAVVSSDNNLTEKQRADIINYFNHRMKICE